MQRLSPIIALGLLLALTSLAASLAHATSVAGRVVGISDGDTLTVLTSAKDQIKVRLAEIDAPEKAQDFGQKSKQSLSDLAYGKDVVVQPQDVDRYGRTVGRVFSGGMDINAEQVQRGMAWVYPKYVKDLRLFVLEREARTARRGLWALSNPIPPWDFRHPERSGAIPQTGASTSDRIAAMAFTGSQMTCRVTRFCSQMTSCEEVKAYVARCGMSKLDRDGDGAPCEGLCSPR